MGTCQHIEPLLAPYVDGEAGASDEALVRGHLEACPACRGRVEAGCGARRILRARTATVAVRAPDALRARCVAVATEAQQDGRASTRQRRFGPLSMAAALVLAVGGVFLYGVTNRSAAVLAAQLTLDHMKCFRFARPADPTDAGALSATLEVECGWAVRVPGGSASEGVTLVGGRRCYAANGRVAHIMYEHRGRPISLFVVPHAVGVARELQTMGHEAVLWSRGDRTYVVVGREPIGEVEHVAAYLRGGAD